MMIRRGKLLLVVAIGLLSWSLLLGDEPSPVDFPFPQRSPLKMEHLRTTPKPMRPEMTLRNRGPKPLRVVVPRGTPFVAGPAGRGVGGQGGMALAAASVVVPAGGSPVRLGLQLLCYQADRPAPEPASAWQPVVNITSEVAEKRRFLGQLATGIEKVDTEVGQLASSVRLRQAGDEVAVRYQGEPLSESSAHLLRVADWSLDEAGRAHGVLNRSAVAQFAFWALTDNYTEEDLSRRLGEPRFAFAQAREASIRWGVYHLLKRSGFKPALFDPATPEVAYNRGVDALRKGNLPEAETLFLTALERRGTYPSALFNLALTYSLAKRWNQAERTWREVVVVLPNDPDVRYNLAVLAYREGDYDEAAGLLKEAIKRDSKHANANKLLPRVRRKLGETS